MFTARWIALLNLYTQNVKNLSLSRGILRIQRMITKKTEKFVVFLRYLKMKNSLQVFTTKGFFGMVRKIKTSKGFSNTVSKSPRTESWNLVRPWAKVSTLRMQPQKPCNIVEPAVQESLVFFSCVKSPLVICSKWTIATTHARRNSKRTTALTAPWLKEGESPWKKTGLLVETMTFLAENSVREEEMQVSHLTSMLSTTQIKSKWCF